MIYMFNSFIFDMVCAIKMVNITVLVCPAYDITAWVSEVQQY